MRRQDDRLYVQVVNEGEGTEVTVRLRIEPWGRSHLAGLLKPVDYGTPVRVPARLLRAVVMRDELSVQSCSNAVQVVITMPHCVILKHELAREWGIGVERHRSGPIELVVA